MVASAPPLTDRHREIVILTAGAYLPARFLLAGEDIIPPIPKECLLANPSHKTGCHAGISKMNGANQTDLSSGSKVYESVGISTKARSGEDDKEIQKRQLGHPRRHAKKMGLQRCKVQKVKSFRCRHHGQRLSDQEIVTKSVEQRPPLPPVPPRRRPADPLPHIRAGKMEQVAGCPGSFGRHAGPDR